MLKFVLWFRLDDPFEGLSIDDIDLKTIDEWTFSSLEHTRSRCIDTRKISTERRKVSVHGKNKTHIEVCDKEEKLARWGDELCDRRVKKEKKTFRSGKLSAPSEPVSRSGGKGADSTRRESGYFRTSRRSAKPTSFIPEDNPKHESKNLENLASILNGAMGDTKIMTRKSNNISTGSTPAWRESRMRANEDILAVFKRFPPDDHRSESCQLHGTVKSSLLNDAPYVEDVCMRSNSVEKMNEWNDSDISNEFPQTFFKRSLRKRLMK